MRYFREYQNQFMYQIPRIKQQCYREYDKMYMLVDVNQPLMLQDFLEMDDDSEM